MRVVFTSPARRCTLPVLGALAALLVAAVPAAAEDWPQFRGPNASGVSASRGLPASFSQTQNVRWKVALGDGISGPVVVKGRLFNTALAAENQFSVFCHDAATGRPLWRKNYPVQGLPRITPPNSHAASTPAADGKRVYVYFSTLGLLALDAATGRELWRTPIPKPAFLMDWGPAVSPVVYRDMVIFCQDDDLAPYVMALDAATGKLRWKTLRSDMLAGYAIPVFCTARGRTDLVVAGTGKLKGYDPATGKERWTCNTLLRTIMTSPVVKDDVIYLAVLSYGDSKRTLKLALLEWLDTNQDKRLAREETPQEFWDKFDRSDKNQDHVLTEEELDTAFQHPTNMVGGGSIVQAIRGGGTGDVTKTHLVWGLTHRAPSNLVSPLVVGNRLHVLKTGGLSTCFDATNGKPLWELSRIGNLGDYYASPVYGDGKIYMAGKNGFVVVVEDGPELKILARNDMGGEEIYATPAIADGRLYIRTRTHLYCIGTAGARPAARAGVAAR